MHKKNNVNLVTPWRRTNRSLILYSKVKDWSIYSSPQKQFQIAHREQLDSSGRPSPQQTRCRHHELPDNTRTNQLINQKCNIYTWAHTYVCIHVFVNIKYLVCHPKARPIRELIRQMGRRQRPWNRLRIENYIQNPKTIEQTLQCFVWRSRKGEEKDKEKSIFWILKFTLSWIGENEHLSSQNQI